MEEREKNVNIIISSEKQKIIEGRDVISDTIGKLLIFVLIMYSVTDELQQCVNDKIRGLPYL